MGDTVRVTCDLQATDSLQIAIGLLIMDRVTINTYDKKKAQVFDFLKYTLAYLF